MSGADTRPFCRLIWLRGRGFAFSVGRMDYYGWRFGVFIGALTILMGRAMPDGGENA